MFTLQVSALHENDLLGEMRVKERERERADNRPHLREPKLETPQKVLHYSFCLWSPFQTLKSQSTITE